MEIVDKIPEGASMINIEGKKGRSILHRPIRWFVDKEFQEISEQYEYYRKLIEGTQEERLIAIIGALSMEEAIDLFLKAYIPNYSHLESQRDFTLFLKINLLLSLRIIPEHILDSATLINTVRNKFAHELKIHCFDKLDKGAQESLKQKHKVFFPDAKETNLTTKDIFIGVVEGIVIALGIYSSHVKVAKEYILSNEFLDVLINRIKTK